MFSGIVQKTACVKDAKNAKRIKRVRIELPRSWKLPLGVSVAVDGICSTVAAKGTGHFDVEYMPETLSKTTAGAFTKGTLVNLERSLKLGDTLDGNLVAGHVDACVKVMNITRRGSATDMSVALPRHLLKFVAPQGSLTLNGVALTVSRMRGSIATVSLIPYTLAHTNLGLLKKGDSVNVEVDLIVRHLATLMKK